MPGDARAAQGARVGLIGARPANFITVRFSEKLFERAGISVETIDLSEIFGRAGRLTAADAKVKAKLDQIKAYVPTARHPRPRPRTDGQARRGDRRLDG